jgi:hypothetical protein
LSCHPSATARGRRASRVQGIGDLAQAFALGSQRLDKRHDVSGEQIGCGFHAFISAISDPSAHLNNRPARRLLDGHRESWMVPILATFVVGMDGVIR